VLSWSFVAAALLLALVPPRLPPRTRGLVFSALSLAAARALWRLPVLPILATSVAVYAAGRALPRLPGHTRAWALGATIVLLVTVFVRFKLEAAPAPTLASTNAVVGLSYFTLKFIQHLVDAAAGRARGVGPHAFVCTIFFLPTYPAGPIERTIDFARELERSDRGWGERALGVERIVIGMGKKFLLADPLLRWALPLLHGPEAAPSGILLAAIDAFAFGLYLDFAAYSDLAIGAARLAGVEVRENFDWPYLRQNPGELWRHWHMSFTGWLRDFVFLPTARRLLRATRRPLPSQLGAQIVTMLVCGLWHGLSWNFVLWGAYQALGLGTHATWRAWRGPAPTNAPLRAALSTVATFHFFAVGLVLFACDVPLTVAVLARALGLT